MQLKFNRLVLHRNKIDLHKIKFTKKIMYLVKILQKNKKK